jgi:DNA-binding beta-propeller fold protein YncE
LHKGLIMKRFLTAAALAGLIGAAHATPTENLGIRVLPAPGAMNIDGKIADWDLSGGIFASDDVENQRDKMAVWMHAMYDKDNLYLLARFRDDTPLNNPGQTIADYGFAGDSLQFRIITNVGTPDERVSHWTNWQGRDGQDLMDIAYGRNFDQGNVKNAKVQGARQAFLKDADGKGYAQEMAIPWKLLTKDGNAPDPKTGLRMTIEPNFTVGVNGRMSLKDIFQPNIRPDRVFTFMSSNIWGPATLENKGKVAPRPVRLADAREFPVRMQNGVPVIDWNGLIQTRELPGFKTIAFTMPADGYISLNIKDKNGFVVRHLLNSAFYAKGTHEVKWDGLTTPSAKLPGQPVAPGEYTWSALWNEGIGLKLRGWAANGGNTPWDNGPGTNWGGDHGDPDATAADATQVYLGWSFAEAGQALVACDLNGNARWSNKRGGMAGVKALAAADGAVYVLGGIGENADGAALYKLNAADGRYLTWGDSNDADVMMKSLWQADANAPAKADFIAAAAGKIYVSFTKAGKVAVLDAKTGQLLNTLNVPGASSLQAKGDQLYVLAEGQRVEACDLKNGTVKTVVNGLTNASGLTVSTDGRIYVGTRDPDNQVKVFDRAGKVVAAFGTPRGRNLLGKWMPEGLRFIQSVTVAPDGKLWIAEQDTYPRRISAWDARTGKLIKEFFGASTYGATGGAIDPLDPNVMVGQGSEWKIDPATGRAACVAVITRDGMANSRFGVGNNGRLYLAVAPGWIEGTPSTSIYERTGEGAYKLRSKFYYENGTTRLWADANGDEKEQLGESTTADGTLRFSGWYMAFTPNM